MKNEMKTFELWVGEEVGHMKMFCDVFASREEAVKAGFELQKSCYEWEVCFVVNGPTLDYNEVGCAVREKAQKLFSK